MFKGAYCSGGGPKESVKKPGTPVTLSACREYMAGAGSVDSLEPKLIAYLIARFSCNNHTICDEELQVVGEDPPLTRLAMHAHCAVCTSVDSSNGAVMDAMSSMYEGLLQGEVGPEERIFLPHETQCTSRPGYSKLQVCIGVGLYPVGAMLNHSCTPNAMQSFAGRRIIFRAMQPIAAGQEATISYVELSATRAERRAALLAGYCFDIDAKMVCKCPSRVSELTVCGGMPGI